MEHDILRDTDLETITNVFECKKCGVMKLLVADYFSKHTLTETRVTSINSLPSVLRNLTPLQLPYNALT